MPGPRRRSASTRTTVAARRSRRPRRTTRRRPARPRWRSASPSRTHLDACRRRRGAAAGRCGCPRTKSAFHVDAVARSRSRRTRSCRRRRPRRCCRTTSARRRPPSASCLDRRRCAGRPRSRPAFGVADQQPAVAAELDAERTSAGVGDPAIRAAVGRDPRDAAVLGAGEDRARRRRRRRPRRRSRAPGRWSAGAASTGARADASGIRVAPRSGVPAGPPRRAPRPGARRAAAPPRRATS